MPERTESSIRFGESICLDGSFKWAGLKYFGKFNVVYEQFVDLIAWFLNQIILSINFKWLFKEKKSNVLLESIQLNHKPEILSKTAPV